MNKSNEDSRGNPLGIIATIKSCHLCEISCGRQSIDKCNSSSFMAIRDKLDMDSSRSGSPFSDRGGLQIRKLFHSVGLFPQYSYLVKCEGSTKVAHWKNCKQHLLKEIETVQPKILVVFGERAAKWLKFSEKAKLTIGNFEVAGLTGFVVPYGVSGIKSLVWDRAKKLLLELKDGLAGVPTTLFDTLEEQNGS